MKPTPRQVAKKEVAGFIGAGMFPRFNRAKRKKLENLIARNERDIRSGRAG